MKTDIKQILQDMKSAREVPSELCAKGDTHEFKFMMHSDGSKSYSNYFKCSNCSEIIVRTQNRTGEDEMLWAD